MIIFYLILAIIVLSRAKIKTNGQHEDYLSFDTTNCIKGVFILFVFIKHATPYITNSGYEYTSIYDKLFLMVDSRVGQWIVAMFLFYSGYGIMESIKKKGEGYINSIPKKRILTTLINFDIAVLIYAIIKYLGGGRLLSETCNLVIDRMAIHGKQQLVYFCNNACLWNHVHNIQTI